MFPQSQVSHIGDALSAEACIEGGFGGLIVDLFAIGKIIGPLNEASPLEEYQLCSTNNKMYRLVVPQGYSAVCNTIKIAIL